MAECSVPYFEFVDGLDHRIILVLFIGYIWFSCELWKSCVELWAMKKLLWVNYVLWKIVTYLVKTTIKPTLSLYLPSNNYKMSLYFHPFEKKKAKSHRQGLRCYENYSARKQLLLNFFSSVLPVWLASFFFCHEKHFSKIEPNTAKTYTYCIKDRGNRHICPLIEGHES